MRKIKGTKRTVGRKREGNNKENKQKLPERRREGKEKRMTNVGTRQ